MRFLKRTLLVFFYGFYKVGAHEGNYQAAAVGAGVFSTFHSTLLVLNILVFLEGLLQINVFDHYLVWLFLGLLGFLYYGFLFGNTEWKARVKELNQLPFRAKLSLVLLSYLSLVGLFLGVIGQLYYQYR